MKKLFLGVAILLISITTGSFIFAQQEDIILLSWNATSEFLAVGRDFSIEIRDTNGSVLANTDFSLLTRLTWSPTDPTLLAATSVYGGQIILFRYSQQDLRMENTFSTRGGFINDVKWSLDGMKLVVASQNDTVADVATIEVLDATDGERLAMLQLEGPTLGTVEWRPDHPDEILLVESENGFGIRFTLWNFQSNEVIWRTTENFGSMTPVHWSPDGEQFVSVNDYVDQILNFHNGNTGTITSEYLLPVIGAITDIDWYPFDNIFVHSSGYIIFDTANCKVITVQDWPSLEPMTINSQGFIPTIAQKC